VKERFTQQLFITATIFYALGTIVLFMQYPDFKEDALSFNLWMFFFLFGTVFIVFTLLSSESNEIKELIKKRKKEEINQEKT
jgi:hypothetical protein